VSEGSRKYFWLVASASGNSHQIRPLPHARLRASYLVNNTHVPREEATKNPLGDQPAGLNFQGVSAWLLGSLTAPGGSACAVPRCQKSILSVRDPSSRADKQHRDRVLSNRTNDWAWRSVRRRGGASLGHPAYRLPVRWCPRGVGHPPLKHR
jgi:hypothetical protein